MEKQKIASLLDQLHEELSSAGELDDVIAAKLRGSMEEIRKTLSEGNHPASSSMIQRLTDAVYHLPDSHPAIKDTVGRVADALSQIGI